MMAPHSDPAANAHHPIEGHTHDDHHGHGHAHAHQHDHAAHAENHGAHSAHHHHGHGHHHHLPSKLGRAFAVGIGLNFMFVMLEAVVGIRIGSLALISDAGHNFGDVIGLLVAGGAVLLAARAPDERYTYGLRGGTILAALTNAMLLLVAVGAIMWACIGRFAHPVPIESGVVIAVACLGIIVNGSTALLFLADRHTDLNARAAYLHMAADAGVSLGVVVAAIAIRYTGWLWIDPAAGIVIGLVIFASTWQLLTESIRLALQGVPRGVELRSVEKYLGSQPGVMDIHDLHIWAMSTTETAMTAHLIMPGGHPGDDAMKRIKDELGLRFGIVHVTLQLELGENCEGCGLVHAQHEPADAGANDALAVT